MKEETKDHLMTFLLSAGATIFLSAVIYSIIKLSG